MKKIKIKKNILIAGAVILIIAIFSGIFFSWLFGWGAKDKGEIKPKEIPSVPTPVPTIEVTKEEEPEIKLDIVKDKSGAVLTISRISDKFSKIEYELIYTAEDGDREVERGVGGGPMEIPTNRQIKEDLLFGTESCTTGTCKRHIDKNVSAGVLTVRLITADSRTWETEKKFTIEGKAGKYQVVWTE